MLVSTVSLICRLSPRPNCSPVCVAAAMIPEANVLLRESVALHPAFREALVDLARGLRSDKRVLQGASTRSLVLMMPALQARALLSGRDFVSPHDLEVLAPFVFGHRLEVAPGVEDVARVPRPRRRACLRLAARPSAVSRRLVALGSGRDARYD